MSNDWSAKMVIRGDRVQDVRDWLASRTHEHDGIYGSHYIELEGLTLAGMKCEPPGWIGMEGPIPDVRDGALTIWTESKWSSPSRLCLALSVEFGVEIEFSAHDDENGLGGADAIIKDGELHIQNDYIDH